MTTTNDDSNITNRNSSDQSLCQDIIATAQVNLDRLDQGASVNSLTNLDFPEAPLPITSVPTETTTLTTREGERIVKTSVFAFINGNGDQEEIEVKHTDEQVIELSDGRTSVTYMLNGATTGIYRTREETGAFTEQTVTIRSLTIPRQNNRQIAVIGEPMTTES
jgi:hypothetical protein